MSKINLSQHRFNCPILSSGQARKLFQRKVWKTQYTLATITIGHGAMVHSRRLRERAYMGFPAQQCGRS